MNDGWGCESRRQECACHVRGREREREDNNDGWAVELFD